MIPRGRSSSALQTTAGSVGRHTNALYAFTQSTTRFPPPSLSCYLHFFSPSSPFPILTSSFSGVGGVFCPLGEDGVTRIADGHPRNTGETTSHVRFLPHRHAWQQILRIFLLLLLLLLSFPLFSSPFLPSSITLSRKLHFFLLLATSFFCCLQTI